MGVPPGNQAVGGGKDIAFFAGVILLINNITGPGVPSLPNLFVEAGWLPPMACIICMWVVTTLSASIFAEAMDRIPGNEGFKGRVEFVSVVDHYFGRRMYVASQIGLNGALMSLNIISVILSAQVMDVLISALFGKSCGLNLTPFALYNNATSSGAPIPGSDRVFSCIDSADLSHGNGWGCHIVLSLGYVLTAAMAIPCGAWNLDDNMIIQQGAFCLTACCWLIWIVAALSSASGGGGAGGGDAGDAGGAGGGDVVAAAELGLHALVRSTSSRLPAINSNPQLGSVAGVLGGILFNFGFVTTVPSWLNEKRPGVPINRTLWLATTFSALLFTAIGFTAALVFSDVLQGPVTATCARQLDDPTFVCANDLLQLLSQPATAPWQSSRAATTLLQASVYCFPIFSIVSSIPVFSIIIKYNCIENGFSHAFGFAWGVIFPWLIGFPLLYMPDVLGRIINITSLFFVSFSNFVLPLALYVVLQRKPDHGRLQAQPGLGTTLLSGTHTTSTAESITHAAPSAMGVNVNVTFASERCDAGSTPAAAEEDGGGFMPLEQEGRHLVLPRSWTCCTSPVRSALAVAIAILLAVGSMTALYLTITQGTYDVDAGICATVGN